MASERPSSQVAYRAVLLAAGLLVLGLLFRQLLTLLLAMLVTVIIAMPLAAAADRLERRGLPRALGALAALLGGLLAVAFLIALELDQGDDHPRENEDDYSDLHPEPRAGHGKGG